MSFTWTDSEITAKATPIRKVHIDELRTNVNTVNTNLSNHMSATNYASHPLASLTNNGLMSKEQFKIVSDGNADTVDEYHADDLIELMQKVLPIGSIIMWSSPTIPEGWSLCDGTNGTPDYRDLFTICGGNSYTLGAKGGSSTVTLDVSQIPSHNHIDAFGCQQSNPPFGIADSNGTHMGSGDTDWDNKLYYTSSTGGGNPHNNMPPYVVTYYIMKTTGLMPTYAGQTGPNADMLDGYHYTDIVTNVLASVPAPETYNGGSSLSARGWQRFSNGLTFEWGNSSANCTGESVVFPKPYTTVFQAYISPGQARDENPGVASLTNVGFYINTLGYDCGLCRWWSIGITAE